MPDDQFHPVANLFPLLEGEEFNRFVDDIRSHGVREAIVRHRDGRIIDGRNRWRASRAAGVDCPSQVFAGDDAALVAFVISANVRRRHLQASQRAMVAAKLATLQRGRPSENPQICAITTEKAAALLGVSERLVDAARAVERANVPELSGAVMAGRMRISRAAQIAKCEPERIRCILAGDVPRKAVDMLRQEATAIEEGEEAEPEPPAEETEGQTFRVKVLYSEGAPQHVGRVTYVSPSRPVEPTLPPPNGDAALPPAATPAPEPQGIDDGMAAGKKPHAAPPAPQPHAATASAFRPTPTALYLEMLATYEPAEAAKLALDGEMDRDAIIAVAEAALLAAKQKLAWTAAFVDALKK